MRRAAVIFVLAAVAGCDGPSSYGEFRDQLAARFCDYAVRCGQLGVQDAAACAAPASLLPVLDSLDVAAELDNHRLHFHPRNARGCLDALKHAPCDGAQASADLSRRCHGIVTAAVATGGTCWADGECVGGACAGALGDGSCSGTCVAYAPPGAACAVSPDAPAQQTCDPTVHYCSSEGVCARKGGHGAACATDAQCLFDWVCLDGKCADPPRLGSHDPCGEPTSGNAPSLCPDGQYCDATHTCAPRVTSGEACAGNGICADGLVCLAGTCQPWLDVGQACLTTTPSGCPASQTCSNATCVSQSTRRGAHQPCQSGDDCLPGLYCNGHTCEYPHGVLGPCASDDDCASPLACDGATKTCRPMNPVTCPAAP